jgi:abhydrolase domain-containing protein 6
LANSGLARPIRAPLAPKPTLIVWGRDDHVFGAHAAQSLQRQIVGSELHQMENAGHLLHMENADEVAPLYAGFLHAASVSSAGGT